MAGGMTASNVKAESAAPLGDLPWPRATALSIEAFGNPCFFAAASAVASLGLN